MNSIPNQYMATRFMLLPVSGANAASSKPARSTRKPKAVSPRLVRFQANRVRSAANSTRGSFRSDMVLHVSSRSKVSYHQGAHYRETRHDGIYFPGHIRRNTNPVTQCHRAGPERLRPETLVPDRLR